jgi:ABC-type phosphate/phosphonate transport system substrate-binding protein
LVVRSDSVFTDLEATRGSRLVATEPPSIGGYGFIAWLLAQDDETPESFFGSVERVVSHEQSLRLLHARAADVACVNRSQLASWPSDAFRIIKTSPEFGMPPLVVSRSVDAGTREALGKAVLGFDVGSDPSAEGSQIDRFVYTDPDAYGFARAVIDFMADDGSGPVGVTDDE